MSTTTWPNSWLTPDDARAARAEQTESEQRAERAAAIARHPANGIPRALYAVPDLATTDTRAPRAPRARRAIRALAIVATWLTMAAIVLLVIRWAILAITVLATV